MVEAWLRTRAVNLAGLGSEGARLKDGFVVNYANRVSKERRHWTRYLMFPDLIAFAIELAVMVEEDAVTLVTNLRKKDRLGRIYRIGDVKRRISLAPPPNPRGIDHDLLIESVGHIAKMVPVMRGGPFGAQRGDRFQGGTI